jgi:hypothetical protein
MNRWEGTCIVCGEHLPKWVEVLEIFKSICTLGREIMLVSGFDGSEWVRHGITHYYKTGFVGRSGARTTGWKQRQGRGVACRDLGCKYLDLDCVQGLSSPGSEI